MCGFRGGNRSFNILLVLAAMLAVLFLLTGCEGKDGPAGPTGPAGAAGIDGSDGIDGIDGGGTRVVYEGTVNASPFAVFAPQITLADMPIVSVFISYDPNGLDWYEIPVWWDGEPGYAEFSVFHEGSVEIFNCTGWKYKVVIIY